MSPHGASARRLLLVEDNPGDAMLIMDLLEDTAPAPDRVVHVATLSDAVARLQARPVDAVLLDLRLPDASGVECVVAIRAHAGDTPIVVLTGLDDDEVALSCIGAGAQDYLSKQEVRATNLQRAIGYAIARVAEVAERRRADALQARLAAIVDASSEAILSIDRHGVINSWNAAAERVFGYTRAEALDAFVYDVIRPADPLPPGEPQRRIAEALAQLGTDEPREVVRLHKDGRRIRVATSTSVLRDPAGEVEGLASICRDVTESRRRDDELRRINAELRARETQMRALTARLHSVREEERTRISREVHDELGQLLTGLKMDLRWIERRLNADTQLAPTIRPKLDEAAKLVDRTIATVQRIAVELRPSALDALGLAAAIRDEARRFQQRSSVVAEVQVRAATQPATDVATALFRVLQELLTNIARHAHATRLEIVFAEGVDAWTLRVEDNGVGIPDEDARRSASLGLLGIQERVAILGGAFRLERGDPRGTVATVTVPKLSSQGADDAARADRR